MISIDTMTRGRLGNRIFHYNNLVQLASAMGVQASCVKWEGRRLFKMVEGRKRFRKAKHRLSWRECLQPDLVSNLDPDRDYSLGGLCLHNVFFELTHRDPRDFLEVARPNKVPRSGEFMNVGIHIRGGDMLTDGNLGREIHPPEYFKEAVELVTSAISNCSFFVATDDPANSVFLQVVNFLRQQKLHFRLGDPKDAFEDFKELAYSDVMISSSSTFSVASCLLGARDKWVIHSAEWIAKNQVGPSYVPWGTVSDLYPQEYWSSFDNFWVRVGRGDAPFYPVRDFV